MADDLRIQICAEADEAASARIIEGQLPSISKQVRERVKVGVEVDESNISSQIKAATKRQGTSSARVVIPVEIGVQADTLKRLLEVQVNTLQERLKKVGGSLDFSNFYNEFNKNTLEGFRQAQKELGILEAKYTNFDAKIAKILPRDAIENLNEYIKNTGVSVEQLITKFQGLRNGVPQEAIDGFEKLSLVQRELAQIPTTDIEARSKKYNDTISTINDLSRQYEILATQQRRVDIGVAFDTTEKRAQKLLATVENLKVKYSAFLNDRNLVTQYNQLFDAAKTAKSAKEIANVNAQIGKFEQVLVSAGKNQRSFGAELSNNIKKMGSWMVLGGLMASTIRGFRDVVTNVKDINVAMTELIKVTNESDSVYNDFLSRSSDNAVKLGTSISSLVQSTADFARLGFDIQDAEKLAQVATMYYQVGDGLSSIDDSTSSIISTMKAFDIKASDSIKIVDLYNQIGNKFAVTSGGIGSAMQRAGAALASSNNSLEQSVALWTAMDEIMQDGDVSSTSLRFITQRMRNTAGQLQEMGEDAEGAAESVTKLQQQIRGLTGVDIMADADTFRSTYDVLKDISDIWDELSDKSQADVIRLLAGNKIALAA